MYFNSTTYEYDEIFATLPDEAKLENFKQHQALQLFDWVCLSNTDAVGHSRNSVIHMSPESVKSRVHLSGTTFWINEWQQVGHFQYDSVIMQAISHGEVDRVVLQRAPCGGKSADLCFGDHAWIPWFRGIYGILMKAFIPFLLYARWMNDPRIFPFHIEVNSSSGVINAIEVGNNSPTFKLTNMLCFERLIRRNVAMDSNCPMNLTTYFDPSLPIHITHVYRNGSRRNMQNHPFFLTELKSQLPQEKFNIISSPTFTSSVEIHHQIGLVGKAQIIIADHGAFQSNIMFMRQGGLMIDIVGDYVPKDGSSYEVSTAQVYTNNFGVFYRRIFVSDLKDHDQYGYDINQAEVNEIVKLIKAYVDSKKYYFHY
eukprot:gene11336-15202_t